MISIRKKDTPDEKIIFEAVENDKTLAICKGVFADETANLIEVSKNGENDFLDGVVRAWLNYALLNNVNFADFSHLGNDEFALLEQIGIVTKANPVIDISEFFSNKKCISLWNVLVFLFDI